MADVAVKRAPAPAPLDVVEAFINTADRETGADELATTRGFRAWLLNRALITRAAAVDERDRTQAITLREALRRAALANNKAERDGQAIRELNRLARDARMVVTFDTGGAPRLNPSATGAEGALARILAAVFIAMLTGQWTRLKSCGNDSCQWAFYDTSKNRSGRWCEMADCGNDAKGRAYRARRRASARTRP
jgi:predicted RNA-binding Zn ribbon-like protein